MSLYDHYDRLTQSREYQEYKRAIRNYRPGQKQAPAPEAPPLPAEPALQFIDGATGAHETILRALGCRQDRTGRWYHLNKELAAKAREHVRTHS